MRWFEFLRGHRSLCLVVILFAFALTGLAWGERPAPAPMADDVMPPNPRLYERIAQGQVRVPRVLTNQPPARLVRAPTTPRALTGTVKVLAALVDFGDKVHSVGTSNFDSLLFAPPVVGRGSLRDYYSEISYGQIDLVTLNQPSGLGWLRAPSNYAYYVNGSNYCLGAYPQNCQKLAEEMVDALHAAGVNFANYDNDHDGYAEPVMLIHAGTGTEASYPQSDIWSHSGSLRTPRTYDNVIIDRYIIVPEYWQEKPGDLPVDMTIGVMAHEMGHGFWDLIDLYDTDYSSRGIGNWSLMALGAWNGPARWGASPAWPDAWSRIRMGVVTPTDVTSNVGNKPIPQAYDNPLAQPVLKLRSAVMGSQEYFLVENREQVFGSYDEYLPGGGLFIWHVDDSVRTGNDRECIVEPHSLCPSSHYLVALEQADGLRHLENYAYFNLGDPGDLFPGATNNRHWTMTTNPESSSWYGAVNSCVGVTNIGDAGANMTTDLQVLCIYYLPWISK